MSDERQAGKPDRGGPRRETRVPPTILIVDDDESVRQLLQDAVSMHGYQSMAAGTVEEAETYLQGPGSRAIRLVVTDIHLTADPQGREGVALYERWSTARPNLKFLMISGDPANRAIPVIRSGVVPFLLKPFTLDELFEIVDGLMRV